MERANALSLLSSMLAIRMRRMSASEDTKPNTKPLETDESKVFDAIALYFNQRTVNEASVSTQDANQQWAALVEKYGQRFMYEFFVEPALIFGVPYKAFVANAIICLALFIATNNFQILLITAPVVHLLCFSYYMAVRKRWRQAKEQQILMGVVEF